MPCVLRFIKCALVSITGQSVSDDRDRAADSDSEHSLRVASAMGTSGKIAKIVGCVSTVEGRPTSGRCQWERHGPERERPTRL